MENTEHKRLRIRRTTQLSGKNGKWRQLPENRPLRTGMPRKTKQLHDKNKYLEDMTSEEEEEECEPE